MEVHDVPLDHIPVLSNSFRLSSLSAEPVVAKILHLIGSGEAEMPSIWVVGAFLFALVATLASILAGARIVRLKIHQKGSDQQISLNPFVSLNSLDDQDRIDLSGNSSPSSSSSSFEEEYRKDNRNRSLYGSLDYGFHHSLARDCDSPAITRGRDLLLWEADNSTRTMNYSPMDESWSVSGIFQPLVESLFTVEDLSEFEEEEIFNTNIVNAWEMGKSKFRQWQQDNISPLLMRTASNPLFQKQNVVRLWDNLKDKALKTLYVQRGLVSAFDSQAILSESFKSDSLREISTTRGRVKGLPLEYSNTLIAGGHVGSSGKTVLNLWDTRMGSSPAAVSQVVNGRNFGIKAGKLHKLYVQHDADTLSVHELRMLGEGPIDTVSIKGCLKEEAGKGKQGYNLLCNYGFEDIAETEKGTWWNEDAVIVNEDDEGSRSDTDDSSCYEDVTSDADDSGTSGKTSSVVSWCYGAVKSISSSFSK